MLTQLKAAVWGGWRSIRLEFVVLYRTRLYTLKGSPFHVPPAMPPLKLQYAEKPDYEVISNRHTDDAGADRQTVALM